MSGAACSSGRGTARRSAADDTTSVHGTMCDVSTQLHVSARFTSRHFSVDYIGVFCRVGTADVSALVVKISLDLLNTEASDLVVIILLVLYKLLIYYFMAVISMLRFVHKSLTSRSQGVLRRQPRPPFRPGNPALCRSHPLVTPHYCRLGDLLCFVFIVCLLYFFC